MEKTTDPDFLREMIGFTAQRLMELKLRPDGAAPGARSIRAVQPTKRLPGPGLAYPGRNRELRIPKLRKGSYFPGFPRTPSDGREGLTR